MGHVAAAEKITGRDYSKRARAPDPFMAELYRETRRREGHATGYRAGYADAKAGKEPML